MFFETGKWKALTPLGGSSLSAATLTNLSYVNIVDGFSGTLSFNYSSFGNSGVELFDGLNGTGTLLSSTIVPADNLDFFPVQIDFLGTARSIRWNNLNSGPVFLIDSITFGQTVDLPATQNILALALLLLLFRRSKFPTD